MNLVAKEFCAARTENDGVLVLSEFAGAAPELQRGALLVNPYDELGIAETINRALAMEPTEQRRRMMRMRAWVSAATTSSTGETASSPHSTVSPPPLRRSDEQSISCVIRRSANRPGAPS